MRSHCVENMIEGTTGMEFNEKLQALRKQKGLTQEALAEKLYVSRTAISKWESGRGYPGIDSLKAIAKFFSVTVDELLSTDEALAIGEEEKKQAQTHFLDLAYGLLDLSMALLFFLPLFALRSQTGIQSVSLLWLTGFPLYLQIAFFVGVIGMVLMGVLFLALQNCQVAFWRNSKLTLSLVWGVAAVLLFVISSQPYAAVFSFVLLTIKVFLRLKRQ